MHSSKKIKNDNNEIKWQYAFYRYVESNGFNFVTENGEKGSILNIGEHNHFEGPDFKNSCVIIDGKILTGDVEFHKKSSDWINHKHSENNTYNNIILHIVFENDTKLKTNFETIVINRNCLKKYIHKQKSNTNTEKMSSNLDKMVNSEIQAYAMDRLLRKTTDIYDLLQCNSINDTLIILAKSFLIKYFDFRRRPIYNISLIEDILDSMKRSSLSVFLYNINDEKYNFDSFLNSFFKISIIGEHLKQEIWTNVVFPLAFYLSNPIKKSELLFWYWSAKTRTKYGILNRQYPEMQQNYIWQQQGLLEYYKETTNYKNVKQETLLINYCIPEFLSYYSLQPFGYL